MQNSRFSEVVDSDDGPKIYAFPGAMAIGSAFSSFPISKVLPCEFQAMGTIEIQETFGFHSIYQLVALRLLPELLLRSPDDAIIGGWSHGASVAFAAASQMEAMLRGPRGVFALDPRSMSPRCEIGMTEKEYQAYFDERFKGGATFGARSLDNFRHQTIPSTRFTSNAVTFMARLGKDDESFAMLPDADIVPRSSLHAGSQEWYTFANTSHHLIGVDHFWDIATALRKSSLERQGPAREVQSVPP